MPATSPRKPARTKPQAEPTPVDPVSVEQPPVEQLTVEEPAAEQSPIELGVNEGETQEIVTLIETVTLNAPLAPARVGANHPKRHIDLQLTRARAATLQRLADGLVAARAELSDGKLVTNGADAVRWILDGMHAVTHREPSETSGE